MRLAPPAFARFTDVARPGAAIVVAGYPYEGRLPAPVLTYGTFEEAGGLDGASGLSRLSVAVQPGDAGGAVVDGAGQVVGMLLPFAFGGAQDLPEGVAFAADSARIGAVLTKAGVSVETGWRVRVTESMADRAAPAVGTSALFALGWWWMLLVMTDRFRATGVSE